MAITHHPSTRSAAHVGAGAQARSIALGAASVVAPAALGIGLVLALCALLGALFGPVVFAEGGIIETASALGYGVAALACAASAVRVGAPHRATPSLGVARDRLLGAALLALLCARELDMHRASPIGSLTRSATYANPDVPLGWRLLAALAMLGVVATAVIFVWRALTRWRRGELALNRRAASVIVAVATLVVAKGLDGIGRTLSDLGVATDPRFDAVAMALEESLELGAPVVLLAVALNVLGRSERAVRCDRRRGATDDASPNRRPDRAGDPGA